MGPGNMTDLALAVSRQLLYALLTARVPQVIDVWNALAERDYGYAQLPRYALGVSSGGAMALVLAKYFPLQVSISCLMTNLACRIPRLL